MCKGSNDFNKITNYEKPLELMQLVKNLLPKKHVLIEIKHTVACNISQKSCKLNSSSLVQSLLTKRKFLIALGLMVTIIALYLTI